MSSIYETAYINANSCLDKIDREQQYVPKNGTDIEQNIQGVYMNKRTKNTENNTMMYMVENDNVETTHKDEDPSMGFVPSIVLFTMYPYLVEDGDTTMPMEHGMALLDIARTTTNTFERPIIAGIVAAVGHMLGIDELIREAYKLLPRAKEVMEQFYTEIRSSGDGHSEYLEITDQLLEQLGIDSSKKQKAMDEICITFRIGEELCMHK